MKEKPDCSIPRCRSKNKKVHSRGWCKNHYNSWLKYGDPEKAPRRAPKGSRGPKPITVKSLKELGLYNAFDISRWCMRHGIQSVYLEYKGREVMEVDHYYMSEGKWVAMDAKQPGKILKKFKYDGASSREEVFDRAAAWVGATYDTEMKTIHCMWAAFPAPAVDLILKEIEIIRKVWSTSPEVVAEVPREVVTRVKAEYKIPKSVREQRKVSA